MRKKLIAQLGIRTLVRTHGFIQLSEPASAEYAKKTGTVVEGKEMRALASGTHGMYGDIKGETT